RTIGAHHPGRGTTMNDANGGKNRKEPSASLDALWDHADPAASEHRFRRLLVDGGSNLSGDEQAEILTQVARALGLQQRFDEGHAILDEIESSATPVDPLIRVRLLLERGRLFNSAGSRDRAVPLFAAALDLAQEHGMEFLGVDAAHMLAIVEPGERSIEWNRRALDLAAGATDPRARRWRGALWNNLGWSLHELGRHEEARQAFEQHLAIRLSEDNEPQAAIARWSMAKMLRHLDRPAEALSILESIRDHPDRQNNASEGYTREEIGNCLIALGRDGEASSHLARAWALLHDDPWLQRDEPERLARLRRLGGLG
ncbi:MAG: tetratricopeptide repeat protein, partial [Phycisphaerales bacterium]|nr:tetratricopeptide repeat protein [Phycisphaerales bacterium]